MTVAQCRLVDSEIHVTVMNNLNTLVQALFAKLFICTAILAQGGKRWFDHISGDHLHTPRHHKKESSVKKTGDRFWKRVYFNSNICFASRVFVI